MGEMIVSKNEGIYYDIYLCDAELHGYIESLRDHDNYYISEALCQYYNKHDVYVSLVVTVAAPSKVIKGIGPNKRIVDNKQELICVVSNLLRNIFLINESERELVSNTLTNYLLKLMED